MAYRKVWGVSLLLDLALMLSVASVHAETDTAPPPAGALAGKIVDAAGQPAAGATVWLFGGSSEDLKDFEKTTTDAQGRFTFLEAKAKYGDLPFGSLPHVFVQSAAGQIGWARQLWSYEQKKPLQDVRIHLIETRPYRGRLVDASGSPIVKAGIRPKSLDSKIPGRSQGHGHDDYYSATLSSEFSQKCRAETADDGSFMLDFLPVDEIVVAEITAPGFGSYQARWGLQKPVTLRLEKPGKIEGVFAAPSGAHSLAGIKLYLGNRAGINSAQEPEFKISPLRHEAVSDKDGRFHFLDLPPGKYTVHPRLEESNLPFFAKSSEVLEVKPGEAVALSLPLQPAVEVRGQVVDAKTGQGIAGVEVAFLYKNKNGPYTWKRNATTDASGKYLAYIEPGKTSIRVTKTPDEYIAAESDDKTGELDVASPIDFPTVKLQKAVQLEGTVVDDSGKVVPDAEVHTLLPNYGCWQVIENADKNGRFSIKRLDGKKFISLRARSTVGVSKTMEIVPADVTEPIRLVLSPHLAFAVKGICVDEAGRLVAGIKVYAGSSWMLGSIGTSITDGSCETDNEGRFEIGALWSGFDYALSVNAENYVRYESSRVKSTGHTHDFGKIVLRDQSGFIEGTIVDSAGKPLADIRVFHSRNSVKPLNAVSDASGRFRLTGLRSGSDYLFAEKDGYRLQPAYLPVRSKGVKIVLARQDEPAPPWKPERPPTSFAEEQAAVRKLLDKLYAVPRRGPKSWSYRFIAGFDQPRALELSKRFNGYYKSEILGRVAEQIADADLEEAIALVNPLVNYQSFDTLCKLAERYASLDAEKASRLMEEAILMARKLDQPDRSQALAKAGTLAVRLGKVEAGRKIIEEAAEAAAKMGTSDRNAFVRSHIAAALAPHDLSRALSLLEPINAKDYAKENGLGLIAVAIAPHKLENALEIVSKLDKSSTFPDNTRLKIAYHLAADRPKDALRVVDSMDTHGAKKIRAEAYGWLAELIAPRDRKLAWSLIDKGFALYEENDQGIRTFSSYGGRGVFAAHLVVKAAKCGYPEIGRLIDRALAMRPVDDEEYRILETQKHTVIMARVLALVDPASARRLLETVAPRCDSLKAFGYPGVEAYDWCEAWALADLPQFSGMMERRLEAAATNSKIDLNNCGLDQTLELLTTPPDRRIPVMDRYTRSFWSPEED
jgi:5-hydroxyisourate hydrolase-like protein (transthyretin family)